MKASEVLRRYAAGERDFRRTNLRGQSFEGQDLSSADFSGADIRGANFTNAILRGANLIEVKAGLKFRVVIVLLVVMVSLAVLSGYSSALVGYQTTYSFHPSNIGKSAIPYGLIVITVVAVFSGFLIAQGLEAAFVALAISLTIGFFVAPAGALISALALVGFIAGVLAVAGTLVIAGSAAGVVTVASIVVVSEYITINGSLHVVRTSQPSFYSTFVAEVVGFAMAFAAAVPVLAAYTGWRAALEDERFTLILRIAVALAAIGGNTSFRDADLTEANFTQANLKGTDFRRAKVMHTCWFHARNLDQARVGNTILAQPTVRELVVTGNGNREFLTGLNLKGVYLEGADLTKASLIGADISEAILRGASLEGANLTRVQAIGTDFTAATLTGACLKSWNIDSTTYLKNVFCEYVYLMHSQGERRPSSGVFAPDEFTKLFQEVLGTVDLIFRNGIDWKAFAYSFNKLVLDNEGTELSIQSIENKGDGVVVVRVNAPPDADKAKLHSEFNQTYDAAVKVLEARYQAELKAKDDQIVIYRQQSADMLEITRLMANRPIQVPVNVQAIAEAKAMNDSTDSSRKIEIGSIGGDFHASGQALNLGDISGTVTNTINQLPDAADPSQPNLKQLLTQLKDAIATDTDLPDPDKADLLEQVQNLAEAQQTEEPAKKEGLARKAKKMFEATLKSLPETAKIAEACTKLLPMILKALGLPM